MTKSEINTLSGLPLDLLIPEHVFGWQWWVSEDTGKRSLFSAGKVPVWFTERATGEAMASILPGYCCDGRGIGAG